MRTKCINTYLVIKRNCVVFLLIFGKTKLEQHFYFYHSSYSQKIQIILVYNISKSDMKNI